MRVSKYLPLSIVTMFFIPVLGFATAIAAITKKGKNRIPFLLISFFYFCFLLKMPPYGDSYRRFLDFESFTQNTPVLFFLHGHPDFFFYLTIALFQKLSIPYFVMPALYGALMIYFILASLRNGNRILNIEMQGAGKVLCFLLMLSSFDIINFSLGLRFGLSIAMSVFGITTFYSGSRLKGVLFLILAVTVHFSMIFVLLCFICCRFVNIKKIYVIPLSFLCFVFSSTVLVFILNQLSFLSIANYALSGYVDSDWANASTNINTLGVFIVRNSLQFGMLFLFILDKKIPKDIQRFICFIIPATFLISISFSAVQRYLVVCNLIIISLVLPSYFNVIFRSKLVLSFFLFYIFASGVVLNIYVQRVAITWGELWVSLYKPPVTLLYYTGDDFKGYLKEVSSDGNWVKNTQGVGGK